MGGVWKRTETYLARRLPYDKDHKDSGKYIVPLPRPLQIIWEINPKWQQWSAEGGKSTGAIEPHKRILVRYDPEHKSGRGEVAQAPTAKSATSLLVRQYVDGVLVNGDANEQAAFDAFIKHGNGSKPESKEALKTWVAVNRHLVNFNNQTKPQTTAA